MHSLNRPAVLPSKVVCARASKSLLNCAWLARLLLVLPYRLCCRQLLLPPFNYHPIVRKVENKFYYCMRWWWCYRVGWCSRWKLWWWRGGDGADIVRFLPGRKFPFIFPLNDFSYLHHTWNPFGVCRRCQYNISVCCRLPAPGTCNLLPLHQPTFFLCPWRSTHDAKFITRLMDLWFCGVLCLALPVSCLLLKYFSLLSFVRFLRVALALFCFVGLFGYVSVHCLHQGRIQAEKDSSSAQ